MKVGRSRFRWEEYVCVAGHQNFGRKKLEECSIGQRRMVSNSEECQSTHRAVESMMMIMMMTMK
jgi:hypothetical protein